MGSKKKKDEAREDLIQVLETRMEQSYCPNQCSPDQECDRPCAALRQHVADSEGTIVKAAEVVSQGRLEHPGGRTEGQTYRKMISAVASKPKGVRKYFRIRSRY